MSVGRASPTPRREFVQAAIAQALSRSGRTDRSEPDAVARALGYHPRVIEAIIKGVGGTSTEAWAGALVDAGNTRVTFIGSLGEFSVFYRLLNDDLMVRVPLRTPIAATQVGFSGAITTGGAPTLVSDLSLSRRALEELTAMGLCVISEELWLAGAKAEEAIDYELRTVCASVVDAEFFARVTDVDTPEIASTGTDAEAASVDLLAVLNAVSPSARSKLLWAMSPDVGLRAAALQASLSGFVFPDMCPTGGTMLKLPAMTTDALSQGTLALIDGSRIAGNIGEVSVDASFQASVQIANPPTQSGATGVGSTIVSTFQTNTVAIRAVATFGVERVKANAVAKLTGVQWGGAIPAS